MLRQAAQSLKNPSKEEAIFYYRNNLIYVHNS